MPVTINGTTGVAGVDGSAGTPAVQGGDTNTGMFFPAADTIAFSTAGSEDLRIGPSGQIGIAGANYGTSGQVLTSAGASAAPSWQDIPVVGASPWVQITAPTNVTAVTNLDITWDETLYSEIKIVLEGVIPAVDGQDLYYRAGYNNGGTIITSGYVTITDVTLGTSANQGLLANNPGSAAGESVSAIINIQSPNSPVGCSASALVTFENDGGSADSSWKVVFARTLQTIDTARLYWQSGDFEAAGTYAVYGLKRTV